MNAKKKHDFDKIENVYREILQLQQSIAFSELDAEYQEAIKVGDTERISALIHSKRPETGQGLTKFALYHGKNDVLDLLKAEGLFYPDVNEGFSVAAAGGQIEMLSTMIEQFCSYFDKKVHSKTKTLFQKNKIGDAADKYPIFQHTFCQIIKSASVTGQIKVLEWLVSMKVSLTNVAAVFAASSGQLQALK